MRREAKFVMAIVMAATLLLPALMPAEGISPADNKEVKIKVASISPMGGKVQEKSIKLSDAKKLVNEIQAAQEAFKIVMDPNSNETEKTWAQEIVERLLKELAKLGLIPAGFVFNLPQFFSPKFAFLFPVISVGSGFSYIPLYPGEAFIGFMLRPIFLQYFLFGYTASVNFHLIPPRLEYWDMVGTQTAMILGFVGIYIDFGKIGYGIPNMQFLLGESLFVTGIDWL